MTVTTEQRWLSATSQTVVGVLNRCTELPVLNALEHSWPEHLGVCAVTKTNYSDVSHLCPLPQPEPRNQSKESLKYKPFLPCFSAYLALMWLRNYWQDDFLCGGGGGGGEGGLVGIWCYLVSLKVRKKSSRCHLKIFRWEQNPELKIWRGYTLL